METHANSGNVTEAHEKLQKSHMDSLTLMKPHSNQKDSWRLMKANGDL